MTNDYIYCKWRHGKDNLWRVPIALCREQCVRLDGPNADNCFGCMEWCHGDTETTEEYKARIKVLEQERRDKRRAELMKSIGDKDPVELLVYLQDISMNSLRTIAAELEIGKTVGLSKDDIILMIAEAVDSHVK